jgi:hypothetical protein
MIVSLFEKGREAGSDRAARGVVLTRGGFWYVRGEDARDGVLTLENAKAYVTAMHASYGCDRVDVEGCGFIDYDGSPMVRLNVTTHHPEHGDDVVMWDVWEEHDGALYGEC